MSFVNQSSKQSPTPSPPGGARLPAHRRTAVVDDTQCRPFSKCESRCIASSNAPASTHLGRGACTLGVKKRAVELGQPVARPSSCKPQAPFFFLIPSGPLLIFAFLLGPSFNSFVASLSPYLLLDVAARTLWAGHCSASEEWCQSRTACILVTEASGHAADEQEGLVPRQNFVPSRPAACSVLRRNPIFLPAPLPRSIPRPARGQHLRPASLPSPQHTSTAQPPPRRRQPQPAMHTHLSWRPV